jgi:hypothetical protein
MRALDRAVLALAVYFASITAADATVVTLDNSPPNLNHIGSFGVPDTQTYGEVFTAPITGELTSFTLRLDNGVGSLYGGVGTWNGTSSFGLGFGSPTNLYQSANVPSLAGGAYTFTPDVFVTAGQQYVAYLSVFADTAATGEATMPLSNNAVPGIDYFVWNNTTDPRGNPSWNYFYDTVDFGIGTAQFAATFVSAPEPTTLALFGTGLFGLGLMRRRKLNRAVSPHALA